MVLVKVMIEKAASTIQTYFIGLFKLVGQKEVGEKKIEQQGNYRRGKKKNNCAGRKKTF